MMLRSSVHLTFQLAIVLYMACFYLALAYSLEESLSYGTLREMLDL